MDLIWFCNYVFLPWLLYVILCWNLSVLSCWDSFCLLCIKQLSSKDTRVSNILRMLPVWWATSTTNCQICIPCSQMSHPSESFSSPLSPTGQQVTAVQGHQNSFDKQHSTMKWLMIDPKTSYEISSVGHPIVFSNIHPFQPEVLSPTFTQWVLFLGVYAIEMINLLCKHCASGISIFIVSVQEFLCTY